MLKRLPSKFLLLLIAINLGLAGGLFYWQKRSENKPAEQSSTTAQTNEEMQARAKTSTVDLTKLPLGDKKTSTSAKKGYVYSCQTSFNGGGAFALGPWIDTDNNTWDLTQKITVDGDVAWSNASWTLTTSGSNRVFTGNGLPKGHNTGTYPIASSDDAYQYDRNPNSIRTQSLSLTLPLNPTQQSSPECVGGEVGIMLTGIPLFNAFDAGGRDAVATEIQDNCDGHPQMAGQYHYHGLSDCLDDEGGGHSALVGYAFDGFGIYGLRGEDGVELSTNDLDECHGHSHAITWDGKSVVMYHYHLTHDFPYSVSCFRGKKAVTQPLSAGEGQPPRR